MQALATIVLSAADSDREPELLSRLKTLAAGDPRFVTAGNRSQERDEVFELVCSHTCAHFAQEVVFAEPDILCHYRGQKWGIACTAIYGKADHAAKAIRKGWNQNSGVLR